MYNFDAKSISERDILNVVHRYYETWNEFDQDDKDTITLEYVNALQTPNNDQNDKSNRSKTKSNSNCNRITSNSDKYRHIKIKVQDSLEKFQLDSLTQYLYKQNKITFNSMARNAMHHHQSANISKRKSNTVALECIDDILTTYGVVQLEHLTNKQLKSELGSLQLTKYGNKDELCQRLGKSVAKNDRFVILYVAVVLCGFAEPPVNFCIENVNICQSK